MHEVDQHLAQRHGLLHVVPHVRQPPVIVAKLHHTPVLDQLHARESVQERKLATHAPVQIAVHGGKQIAVLLLQHPRHLRDDLRVEVHPPVALLSLHELHQVVSLRRDLEEVILTQNAHARCRCPRRGPGEREREAEEQELEHAREHGEGGEKNEDDSKPISRSVALVMAWRCSGSTNAELVANLEREGFITHPVVRDAMLGTDRGHYVPAIDPSARRSARYQYGPYADAPQSIGHKVTISAPYIHAVALGVLCDRLVEPGCRVLDVGSGSGVLTACMARMVGLGLDKESSMAGGDGIGKESRPLVVGLEIVEELVGISAENMRRDGLQPTTGGSGSGGGGGNDGGVGVGGSGGGVVGVGGSGSGRLVLRHGNGWQGASDLGPFDAIHVGAAASAVPPELVEQLAPGGRMVIPVGEPNGRQVLMQVDKSDDAAGTVEETVVPQSAAVRFVPLVKSRGGKGRGGRKRGAQGGRGGGGGGEGGGGEGGQGGTGGAGGAVVDWDARYQKGWAYGKDPNQFVAHVVEQGLLPSPGPPLRPLRVLSLAKYYNVMMGLVETLLT